MRTDLSKVCEIKDNFDTLVEKIVIASKVGSQSDKAKEIAKYANEIAEHLENFSDVLRYATLQQRPSMLYLYIDMLRNKLQDASVSLEYFRSAVVTVL